MRNSLFIASFLAASALPMLAIAADDHHATVQPER